MEKSNKNIQPSINELNKNLDFLYHLKKYNHEAMLKFEKQNNEKMQIVITENELLKKNIVDLQNHSFLQNKEINSLKEQINKINEFMSKFSLNNIQYQTLQQEPNKKQLQQITYKQFNEFEDLNEDICKIISDNFFDSFSKYFNTNKSTIKMLLFVLNMFNTKENRSENQNTIRLIHLIHTTEKLKKYLKDNNIKIYIDKNVYENFVFLFKNISSLNKKVAQNNIAYLNKKEFTNNIDKIINNFNEIFTIKNNNQNYKKIIWNNDTSVCSNNAEINLFIQNEIPDEIKKDGQLSDAFNKDIHLCDAKPLQNFLDAIYHAQQSCKK